MGQLIKVLHEIKTEAAFEYWVSDLYIQRNKAWINILQNSKVFGDKISNKIYEFITNIVSESEDRSISGALVMDMWIGENILKINTPNYLNNIVSEGQRILGYTKEDVIQEIDVLTKAGLLIKKKK